MENIPFPSCTENNINLNILSCLEMLSPTVSIYIGMQCYYYYH